MKSTSFIQSFRNLFKQAEIYNFIYLMVFIPYLFAYANIDVLTQNDIIKQQFIGLNIGIISGLMIYIAIKAKARAKEMLLGYGLILTITLLINIFLSLLAPSLSREITGIGSAAVLAAIIITILNKYSFTPSKLQGTNKSYTFNKLVIFKIVLFITALYILFIRPLFDISAIGILSAARPVMTYASSILWSALLISIFGSIFSKLFYPQRNSEKISITYTLSA